MESLFLMITSEMTTSVSVPSPMHRRNVTPVISLPDLDWVLFPDDNLRNDLLSTLIISAGIERGEPTKELGRKSENDHCCGPLASRRQPPIKPLTDEGIIVQMWICRIDPLDFRTLTAAERLTGI